MANMNDMRREYLDPDTPSNHIPRSVSSDTPSNHIPRSVSSDTPSDNIPRPVPSDTPSDNISRPVPSDNIPRSIPPDNIPRPDLPQTRPRRTLTENFTPFWGIDLFLILLSVTGAVLIVLHLSEILLFLATSVWLVIEGIVNFPELALFLLLLLLIGLALLRGLSRIR